MSLTLTNLPSGFHHDPYPHYARLREDHPVCGQPDGSFIVSRYADLDMIYRDTARFISDKKKVFAPKYGTAAPLYEHHTTSLVFNDPPLHTRVRKIMVGAMNPRALASMEPGLVTLVDSLLDEISEHKEVDLIDAFAGAIPIEVIGNLFNIPRERRGPLRDSRSLFGFHGAPRCSAASKWQPGPPQLTAHRWGFGMRVRVRGSAVCSRTSSRCHVTPSCIGLALMSAAG